jgi:hypothetical protein
MISILVMGKPDWDIPRQKEQCRAVGETYILMACTSSSETVPFRYLRVPLAEYATRAEADAAAAEIRAALDRGTPYLDL